MTDLGRIGLWSGQLARLPAPRARELVRLAEELGYGTVWINESFAREALTHAGLLLGWTRRVAVATGVANIWARDPLVMASGARTLAEAHPGRFLLGMGVSHAPLVARRGHHYTNPLNHMREYLLAMDALEFNGPVPQRPAPRLLGALGPKMLQLSAELADGAHPYFVPVEHSRQARQLIGPDRLLAPEQAVVLCADPVQARARARGHMAPYLGLRNYSANLLRLGWSDEDLADGGSDDLVDAMVAWGDVDAVAARIHEHFDAGADHVAVQVVPEDEDVVPLDDIVGLAPALLG